MHMQDGIGRGGYRILALVFLGIGVLGIVATLYAFRQAATPRGFFDWLGFALTLVALLALSGVTFLVLRKPGTASATESPSPAGAPPPPSRPIDFEFKAPAPKPEPETGPEVAVPLPPRPEAVLPPNRNIGRDAKGWPRRQPPSGLTMGERKELQQEAVQLLAKQGPPEEIEFVAAPKRPNGHTGGGAQVRATPTRTAKGREMAIRIDAPTMVARVADARDDPEWDPPGMTKGRCGNCGTLLYAPQVRPLHLRCPKCEKLTLLE